MISAMAKYLIVVPDLKESDTLMITNIRKDRVRSYLAVEFSLAKRFLKERDELQVEAQRIEKIFKSEEGRDRGQYLMAGQTLAVTYQILDFLLLQIERVHRGQSGLVIQKRADDLL